MNSELKRLLDHLAQTVDPLLQGEITDLHQRALSWQPIDRLPLVCAYPLPQKAPFKPFRLRLIYDDPAKMMYNELLDAWNTRIAYHAQIDDDLPYTIRANFGTVIIASLFRGRVEQIGDNPPWIRSSFEKLQTILECDPLDFGQGWCPRVIETYEFYKEVLAGYPELQKSIRVVLPDLQGPLDTAEQLRGSPFFLDLYDNPDLVGEALGAITTAQVGFARHLSRFLHGGPNGITYQHGVMIRGNILIRADSAIMISPKMYRECVAPHDEFVLKQMEGGGVHSCGRVDHLLHEFLSLPSIQCVDLGQPQLNDCDELYRAVQSRKIPLTRLQVSKEELVSARVLDRFPTGVSLVYTAESIKDAQSVVEAYKSQAAKR